MSRAAAGLGDRLRAAALAVAVAAAAFGWATFAAIENRRWYAGLVKPFFAPEPWLAGLLLAAAAAAASAAIYAILLSPDYHPDRSSAVRMTLGALALAAAWVWAFFAGRHPTLSLALAAALVIVSAWAVRRSGGPHGSIAAPRSCSFPGRSAPSSWRWWISR